MEISEGNNNHEFSVNRCDYGSLKDMPRAVLSLLKNKTYVCISIGAALDAFLLAGNFFFLRKHHKYFENDLVDSNTYFNVLKFSINEYRNISFQGMAAFLPKYLEYQFGLTSGQAAMLVGAIIVPAGAGGTLLGGYMVNVDIQICIKHNRHRHPSL
jgi:hypothetical protein